MGSLSQILSWLSHSPSDMESYIRPGCVVLSIYLSMSSLAWAKVSIFCGYFSGIHLCFCSNLMASFYIFFIYSLEKFLCCSSKRTLLSESISSFSAPIQVSGETQDSWFIRLNNWSRIRTVYLECLNIIFIFIIFINLFTSYCLFGLPHDGHMISVENSDF